MTNEEQNPNGAKPMLAAAPVNYEIDTRKIGELTVSEFSGLLRNLMIR